MTIVTTYHANAFGSKTGRAAKLNGIPDQVIVMLVFAGNKIQTNNFCLGIKICRMKTIL